MHHFIGSGLVSDSLGVVAEEPARLIAEVTDLVSAAEMTVVSDLVAGFENGGMTVVWVLAESHLVLHYWALEGFATLDLHVCDYGRSNAERAARLVESLSAYCFSPGSQAWRELHLESPVAASADPALSPSAAIG